MPTAATSSAPTAPDKATTAIQVPGLTGATAVAVPQFALTISTNGSGTGTVTPVSASYDAGSQVALTAGATNGKPTRTVTIDKSHSVVATFVTPPSFCDVNPTDRYFEAIRQLAARGVIRGFDPGDGTLCFAPDSGTKRAQMAALIARPLGWDAEDHGNAFSDQNGVDNDLWRNVGALAFYQGAKGYKPETCQALGVAAPCYGPTDEVLYAQVISFITRGMVQKGYW